MMRYMFIVFSLFLVVGCSFTADEESNAEEEEEVVDKRQENIVRFGEVDIKVLHEVVHVKGLARSKYDEFYYVLEMGEDILIDETKEEFLDVEEVEGWREFEFEIDILKTELEDGETPYITLYGKEDGEIMNKHFVPIDILQY
ncbi:MAG TPA: hypothetical protein VK125_00090 [Bacillota bacterium]|nr:hypothetical protein [Bacillota bacterium]